MATSSVVQHKGSNDYAKAELRRFVHVHEIGRTQAILQTDQENSIRNLARSVATLTGLAVRATPKYEHQANGAIERCHSTLWDNVRTLRQAVEENYGVILRAYDTLTTWMVKHATWIYNRYQLHKDGMTSYERRWGTAYQRTICEFAETVLYRASNPTGPKMDVKWDYGLWLGKCTYSDEHYVGTKDEVLRTMHVKRLPPSERYDKELLLQVTATPWKPKLTQEEGPLFVLLPTTTPSVTVTPRVAPPPGLPTPAPPPAPTDMEVEGEGPTDEPSPVR